MQTMRIYLLDCCELEGEDYSISIERLNPFPNCIIIIVDTESFGVAPVHFETFKRLIGNLDSFSSSMARNGKMRYYFEISDMFMRQK